MYIHAGAGHSWIAILGLVVVMGLRMYSVQRRRQGRTGPPRGARGFTSQGGSPSRAATTRLTDTPPTASPGFSGTAPGWFVDPFVRHEQRYWSGAAWTEHVTDNGSPSVDPPPVPPTGD